MAKMGYQDAKKIRGQSLSSRITDRLVGGEKISSSIGKSISEGTRARITGLKEKVDPLNIAKFMMGGSKLGTALAGRMMGRSQEDIEHFTGSKSKGKGTETASKLGKVEEGGSSLDILHKIYSLLSENNSSEKLAREEENNMAEGREMEKKRRHDELIAAIKGMGGKQTATVVGKDKKEESGGMFDSIIDFVKKMIDDMKQFIQPILDMFTGELMKSLLSFGRFLLGNPAVIAAIAWAIGMYKAKEFLDDSEYGKRMSENEGKLAQKAFKEKKTDFTQLKLSKDDAQAILDQPEGKAKTRDIESFGGIERIQAIAAGKPDPGGKSLQKPIDNNTPTNQTAEFQEKKLSVMPETVEPRPTAGGLKGDSKKKTWDEKYAQYYNPDGTKKVPTATPVTAPAAAAAATAPVPASPVSSTPPPPVSAPTSAPLNEKVNENQNLNLPPTPNPAPATTVNNTNVSNNSKPQQAIGKIPSVRNTEKTFSDMILYSTRVV